MKMSVEQAYKILAVPRSADIKAIKKKYRKLMLKVHPDSLKSGKNTYQYSAQEINEASAKDQWQLCNNLHWHGILLLQI